MKVRISYELSENRNADYIIDSNDEQAIRDLCQECLNNGFYVEYIEAPDGGWTKPVNGQNVIRNTDYLRRRYVSVKYRSVYDKERGCRVYDEQTSIDENTEDIMEMFKEIENVLKGV